MVFHWAGCRLARAVLWLVAVIALSVVPTRAAAVPSFSRQLETGCGACHTAFPQIDAFARKFKAKAYTSSAIEEITAEGAGNRTILALAKRVPLSAMMIGSFTVLQDPTPGDDSSDVLVPDQLSLFYAGKIAPGLGAFLQLTYDSQEDHFSMDNMDMRYAYTLTVRDKELVIGATINNNPTVSDLWNTTPAWGWPFVTSGVWPGEGSNSALVDGGLAQAAVGGGLYAFWNEMVYAEAAVYRSAPLGVERPFNGSTSNVIKEVAPYWRVALDHSFGLHDVELGTYGLYAAIYPGADAGLPLSGATDKYLDVGVDAQYQYYHQARNLSFALHTTWIYEHRDPDASAPGESAVLHTFRIDANGYWRWAGVSAGFFLTEGKRDAEVFGTVSGRPDTNGLVFALVGRPWLNTLFVAQYTLYNRIDGREDNYDGAGREASDENTFSVIIWVAF